MKKKKTPLLKLGLSLCGVFFMIALWYLASYLMRLGGNTILPYPHDVFVAFFEILFHPGAERTYLAVDWSILRVVLAVLGSFLLGAVLGTIAGLYPSFSHFMAPGVSLMRSLPTAAVLTVLVAIFYGYRGLPDYIPVILGILIGLPIVYEAFRSGIADMDKDVGESLELDAGRKSLRGVVFVSWPMSGGYIKLALIQTVGLCLKVTIMSELMISGGMSSGLGVLIGEYQMFLEMDKVIAVSLLSVLLILAFDLSTSALRKAQKAKLKLEHAVSTEKSPKD